MNMILHNNPTALIVQGNTLADPKFKDGDTLKTFDYVVANPPFSDKRWSTGLDPLNDPYRALQALRHAAGQAGRLRLPAAHRPLAQEHRQGRVHPAARRAVPRQRRGRHPPRPRPQGLHQGHHRPARQPLLRHRHPRLHRRHRQGGRPGPQGHLHDRRQRWLHEGRPQEPPARAGHPQDRGCLQPAARSARVRAHGRRREIEKNEFNLNLPRYIDSQTPRTCRTSTGHLQGGIPVADVDALARYWARLPAAAARAVQAEPPRLPRPRRGEGGHQVHHLRAPGVRRLHRRHERPLRRLAEAGARPRSRR